MSANTTLSLECLRKTVSGETKISTIRPFHHEEHKGLILIVGYPADFTFVCPREIKTFMDCLGDFSKLGVEVMFVSPDTPYCHQAWVEAPESKRGLGREDWTPEGQDAVFISDPNCILQDAHNLESARFSIIKENGLYGDTVEYKCDFPEDLNRDPLELLRVAKSLTLLKKSGMGHFCISDKQNYSTLEKS